MAAAPSFLMYSKLVQVAGGKLNEVPLKNFHIDLDAMLAALTPKTRVIFINTPNNPAGTAVKKTDLSRFLDQVPAGVVVALDEAYIDFATDPECAQGVEFSESPHAGGGDAHLFQNRRTGRPCASDMPWPLRR